MLAWRSGHVSFRRRASAWTSMAVGLAVAIGSVASYLAVSSQLSVDVQQNLVATELSARALVASGPMAPAVAAQHLESFQSQTGDTVQVLIKDRVVTLAGAATSGPRLFPISPGVRSAQLEGPGGPSAFDFVRATTGAYYEVMSEPVGRDGMVVQVGYPLAQMDKTLASLRAVLAIVVVAGMVLAMIMGWSIGIITMRPVALLTRAVKHVASTGDLSERIADTGEDELGTLARSFNTMLERLAKSRAEQAQLVSDAGHELRTPLTSLKTNVETLLMAKQLPPARRAEVLGDDELLEDLKAQLGEMTDLVADLVELARDEETLSGAGAGAGAGALFVLPEVLGRAVQRARLRAPNVRFELSVVDGTMWGRETAMERAVMNVLDNAAKWSPKGGLVEVSLRQLDGRWSLVVADQGPGIPDDALPRVFDRFYRASSARSLPGSGLGLAIVKKTVTSHGGNVHISCPPGGGTVVAIDLPLPTGARGAPGTASGAELPQRPAHR